ncbi:DedA family protein [Candidatus Saccharibacteria bacterium]|nr:DedA family protein [Candidatus Saccharibacteria bacterium]
MPDVHTIVQTGGILAVAAIIFAESGLLIGFFLPGDTLLLTAGLFAGQGKIPILWLIISVVLAAIIGYQVGYIFGERIGPKLFKRKDGILLREDYIERTNKFFDKYGAVTVVAARFIAHVRTFVSVIAGAGHMNKRAFLTYNIIGAVLWGSGLTLIGYWLGSNVSNVDQYFFPVVIGGLIAIYMVTFWGLAKNPQRRAAFKKGLKEDFDYFFRNSKV